MLPTSVAGIFECELVVWGKFYEVTNNNAQVHRTAVRALGSLQFCSENYEYMDISKSLVSVQN